LGWRAGCGSVFRGGGDGSDGDAVPAGRVDTVDHDGAKRWKKSDIAKVQVESDRALASLTAADFVNGGVTVGSGCSRMCTMGATCACFDVDLAVQPYVQTTGEVFGTVDVALKPLVDVYGNATNGIATKQFQVTRLKWVKQVSGAGTTPTAIAISPNGLVIAGGHVATGSALVAASPDGGTEWTVSNADFTAGPMAGTQGVYVAFATAASVTGILQYNFTGQPRATPQVCGSSVSYFGDLALVLPGGSEFPVAIRNEALLPIEWAVLRL
jgi:hypothetical protein